MSCEEIRDMIQFRKIRYLLKNIITKFRYRFFILKNLLKSSDMRFAAKRAFSRFAYKAELILSRFFNMKKQYLQSCDKGARNCGGEEARTGILIGDHDLQSSDMHAVESRRWRVATDICKHDVHSSDKRAGNRGEMSAATCRGFAMVEILMAALLGSAVVGGTFKVLEVSLQSSRVAKSTLNEQELTVLVGNVLNTAADCQGNLQTSSADFTKLSGSGANEIWRLSKLKKNVGAADEITLLQTGQSFQNNLEIIDMQLRSGGSLDRQFVVFYKKKNMGDMNTLGGGSNCDSTNQEDCYYAYCDLNYNPVPPSGTPTACANPSCVYFNAGGGGGSAECYKVTDASGTPQKATLVGCGDTHQRTVNELVAVGFESGKNTTAAGTFIGYQAGKSSTSGSNNTFIGYKAGEDNTTSGDNTFIGYQAGEGANNHSRVFVGYRAGQSNTQDKIVAVGFEAARSSSANSGVFVGYQAGKSDTGYKNTFIGYEAGESNEGGDNTYVGYQAGYDSDAGGNTFVGSRAGYSGNTGSDNTFVGYKAGENNTSGEHNIYIGMEIGKSSVGGVSASGDYQLNIGNLIFGKMPSTEPTADFFSSTYLGSNDGIVINGNLYIASSGTPSNLKICNASGTCTEVKLETGVSATIADSSGIVINGSLYIAAGGAADDLKSCGGGTCTDIKLSSNSPSDVLSNKILVASAARPSVNSAFLNIVSSEEYKKNITPFTNYDQGLKDVLDMPLFHYEYKDHYPEKRRMGFISEKLPEHLQIVTEDGPSEPDMPSIYGTVLAAIKAMYHKYESFKKNVSLQIQQVSQQLSQKQQMWNQIKQKQEQLQLELQRTQQELRHTQQVLRKAQQELQQVKKVKDRLRVLEQNQHSQKKSVNL